jgi:hypothetical protein
MELLRQIQRSRVTLPAVLVAWLVTIVLFAWTAYQLGRSLEITENLRAASEQQRQIVIEQTELLKQAREMIREYQAKLEMLETYR